jgi:hypothetical protein
MSIQLTRKELAHIGGPQFGQINGVICELPAQ